MHFRDQVCTVYIAVPPAITSDSVSIVANQRAQLYSGVLVELLFTPLRVIVWHHLRSTCDTLALITITVFFYVFNLFSFIKYNSVKSCSSTVGKSKKSSWRWQLRFCSEREYSSNVCFLIIFMVYSIWASLLQAL